LTFLQPFDSLIAVGSKQERSKNTRIRTQLTREHDNNLGMKGFFHIFWLWWRIYVARRLFLWSRIRVAGVIYPALLRACESPDLNLSKPVLRLCHSTKPACVSPQTARGVWHSPRMNLLTLVKPLGRIQENCNMLFWRETISNLRHNISCFLATLFCSDNKFSLNAARYALVFCMVVAPCAVTPPSPRRHNLSV
jgi:hypothetical protein